MDKIPAYILRTLIGFATFALCLFFNLNTAFAQRYTFTHYDIENGLIQSQVNKVYQDNSHRLWIGTLGGACRFDGMDYYALSKATGLLNNFVYAVYCDKKGTVWFGTSGGLASFSNDKQYNFKKPTGTRDGWVTNITQDGSGTIWGVMDNRLFKVIGNKITKVKVDGKYDTVTTITVNKRGKLYAAVKGVGVFGFNGKVWDNYVTLPPSLSSIYAIKMLFDRQNPDRLFVQAYKYILSVENHNITEYAADLLKDAMKPYLCMEQDNKGKLWIGTNIGAYSLDVARQKLIRFGAHNGFSDAPVSDIYRDKDNNLWLGTQGNGLFKYNGDDYVIYTESGQIKENPIVMALGKDSSNRILLGIDGGGVSTYDGKMLKNIWLSAPMTYSRRVQSLYTDRQGIVWIGTSLGGFWRYDGKAFTVIKGTERNSVSGISEDADGMLWLGTPRGVYYYDRKDFHSVGANMFTSSLLMLGKDSILLGTQEGLGLIVKKKLVPNFKINLLGQSAILCIIKYKNLVIAGTDDQGIYLWDRATGRVSNYQAKDGLKANSIYGLAVDEHGLVWAGTGRGVSRLAVNDRSMVCKIIGEDETKDRIIESNQNAIIYSDHKMFVGTTKGLAVFNTALPVAASSAPYMIINSIKLFTQDNSKTTLLTTPAADDRLVLSASQNHLSISFLGVYLKSPENVSYQYRLKGLDDKFCWPVKNDVVDYPSLPPGHYTFEVKAISGEGQISKNIASFSFEITPPFYRTYIFQLGVILFLIATGVVIQNILHQRKIQRQRALETMKREEKLKIRQQTAEDFHDDLGNKLTRITVLSDILDAKLDKQEAEQKKLVLQIKQNASALYNGTRDILWAMDPKSDNLYEVLNHIKETGIEIFEDTHVEFTMEGINDDQTIIKLPMEYSRNITMIFKELLNNVLKHADAHHVKVEFTQPEKDEAKIRIADDGTGFDIDTTKRGHGLNNVKARAKRIGGQMVCTSQKGKGAVIDLMFRINKKG